MKKTLIGTAPGLAVAALAYVTVPGLSVVGDFGIMYAASFQEPAARVYNETGGWVIRTPDRVLELRDLDPAATGYAFHVRRNEAVPDTYQVAGTGEAILDARSASDYPDGLTYEIRAQEDGLQEQSAALILELPPCGTPPSCRILQRRLQPGRLYELQTWRADRTVANRDFLNPGETTQIVLPPDDTFRFVWRAWDDSLRVWRAPSPVFRVETRLCADPPTDAPELADAYWANGWTLRFQFADPGAIDETTVDAADFLLSRDGSPVELTATPAEHWDEYWTIYCDGCAGPGAWNLTLLSGAVADTAGTVNPSSSSITWTEG